MRLEMSYPLRSRCAGRILHHQASGGLLDQVLNNELQ